VETVMSKGKSKNIYNVSTDEEYSILEVTKMLCQEMNVNFDDVVEWVEDRPFNDPCYHSKSNKLRKLGWKPKYTLKQYLPELIEWYKNNRSF
jgi:dTDP-D-glucose 4,6-dehydratase